MTGSPNLEFGKEYFFCLNSLLKSVDFEHFWVNHDSDPKFGIREGRLICLRSLFKSVDFGHFLVNHDPDPKMKHLREIFFGNKLVILEKKPWLKPQNEHISNLLVAAWSYLIFIHLLNRWNATLLLYIDRLYIFLG